MRIEMDDLQKVYGRGTRALDRIGLSMESPSMIGLVGPNGAGKTTLMQLLVGQMLPSAGTIWVDGADLQRQGKAFRRPSCSPPPLWWPRVSSATVGSLDSTPRMWS